MNRERHNMGKCDWEGHKQNMTEGKDSSAALALFGSGRIQAVSGKTGSEIQ